MSGVFRGAQLIILHKELGILVLSLAAIRLIWRLWNKVPSFSRQMPEWQKAAARTTHWALYGFMFAQPITGWFMSPAGGFPVTFLGLFKLPPLIEPNVYHMYFFIEVHKWLAYGLIAAIILHAGAALFHHFFYKDDTLRKMLP